MLYEDRDTDEMIDRFKEVKKVSITENIMSENINDEKVVESFVWYCFGKLDDETIQNYITSYKEDIVEYYRDKMSKSVEVDGEDEDMNKHNIEKIHKDTEHQKDKVDKTLLQFTDRLGFSKDSWKKMLGL